MSPMAAKYLIIRIDESLRSALDAHCAAHALEHSALIRRLLAREIGRPDLAAAMLPRGRPPRGGKSQIPNPKSQAKPEAPAPEPARPKTRPKRTRRPRKRL